MSSEKTAILKLNLTELQQGNQKAFRKLFDMYWDSMFLQAMHIVADENVAKDIIQDIWIKLWQKRTSTKIENFDAYVSRAVKNSCYKYFRDNKFTKVQLDIINDLSLTVKSEVNKKHDLDATLSLVKHKLNNLPRRCVQVFELSRFKEYSNEEIASELGISKKTVENQISLAIRSLKQTVAILVCLIMS
ncbi:MAG: RNA polymerase sigma factor [Jejuia sp.]